MPVFRGEAVKKTIKDDIISAVFLIVVFFACVHFLYDAVDKEAARQQEAVECLTTH